MLPLALVGGARGLFFEPLGKIEFHGRVIYVLRKALLMLDYSCLVKGMECLPPFCQEGQTKHLGPGEGKTV